MPASPPAPIDVLFLGGGIAGLWAWRHALLRGYSAALISTTPLGAGQTIASQGIIHGGIKYALGGEATRASRAIAAMPDLWHASLRGQPRSGHPSLAGAAYLSHGQHLWTTTGLLSRIAGFAASKTLRTGVKHFGTNERPEFFRGAPSGVSVYAVDEPVLNVASVVESLGRPAEGPAPVLIQAVRSIEPGPNACAVGLTIGDGQEVDVIARRVVLCAGKANAGLLRLAGVEHTSPMQLRPLHMVMVRAPAGSLPPLFGHCLGPSLLPRLTVSTAQAADGGTVWYLGGRIAEDGVPRTRTDHIDAAKAELAACLPWMRLPAKGQWATLRIERAEGLTPSGSRPDEPVVTAPSTSLIVAWPTKLAFAPLTAERIASLLGDAERTPVPAWLTHGPMAQPARAPWDDQSVEWSA